MKKSKLAAAALLAGMLVLPGCGEKEDSSESGSDEPAVCQHVDENKDHECDLCHENVGEHADHDNDHMCEYCEQKVSEHSYGDWSEKSPANFEHKKVEHRFCSICGDEQTREVGEVVPHNFKEEWSHDGEKHWHDCTDTGYETLKDSEGVHVDEDQDHLCDVCDLQVSEHSYGEWTEKSPADFEHKKVEHRICSICGDEQTREVGEVVPHNFKEEWSHDGEKHWHDCTDTGYETLKDSEGVHVDENQDHLCDVCEENIPWVESITLDYLTGYIGSGESVTFKANVVAHNGASEEVVWKLGGTGTSKATLVDNEDGTATLTGAEFTGTSSYSVKVSASSAFDESISSAEEPVTIATYGDSKRNQLNDYFGEDKWQTIPYFLSTTFTISNNKLTGKSTGRTIAQMINSFDSQGLWVKESSSESGAHYTFVDGYYSYVLDVSANPSSSGKGMITITKTLNIPEVLQKTFAFTGYDTYGSCDMPITLEITSSGATLTCFASDVTVNKNMKCVVLGENEFKFIEPDEGYYDYYVVVKIEGSDVILEEIGGEYFMYYWTMTTPTKIEEAAMYSISVNELIENGSVSFNEPSNPSKVMPGIVVDFVVTPAKGYEIDQVSISGAEVTLNELYGNRYTFAMPKANVVVNATFKEIVSPAPAFVKIDWSTIRKSHSVNVEGYGICSLDLSSEGGERLYDSSFNLYVDVAKIEEPVDGVLVLECTDPATSEGFTFIFGWDGTNFTQLSEVPASANFSWETFEGSFEVTIYLGMGGQQPYTFAFNNGVVTGHFGSLSDNNFVIDTNGCSANQIHITGNDEENWVAIDVIVESTDGQAFNVVKDNTTDMPWSF